MLIAPSSFTILPQEEFQELKQIQSSFRWLSICKDTISLLSKLQNGVFPKEFEEV